MLCCCINAWGQRKEKGIIERKNKKVSGCVFFFFGFAIKGQHHLLTVRPTTAPVPYMYGSTAAAACAMSGRRGWIGIDAWGLIAKHQLLLIFSICCNVMRYCCSSCSRLVPCTPNTRGSPTDRGASIRSSVPALLSANVLFFRSCTRRPVITRSRTASECQGGRSMAQP